jgi:hypothetical protein
MPDKKKPVITCWYSALRSLKAVQHVNLELNFGKEKNAHEHTFDSSLIHFFQKHQGPFVDCFLLYGILAFSYNLGSFWKQNDNKSNMQSFLRCVASFFTL